MSNETVDWTDPTQVAAAMGVAQEVADEPEVDAKPKADGENPEGPATPEDASQQQPDDEERPRGVQTKSKGRVLPYSVLEDARKDAHQAKQKASELEAELEKLRNSPAAKQAEAEGDDVDELLKKLTADSSELDYEDLIKAVAESRKESLETQKRLQAYEKRDADARKAAEQEKQQLSQDELLAEHEEALKAVPLLEKRWKKGGVFADQATSISDRLMADPKYKYTTRAQHYKDVERELADFLGVPLTGKPKPLPDAGIPEPASLSTITGGAAPETTESEAFLGMDPMKSVALLAKMDPRKQSEFINRAFGG